MAITSTSNTAFIEQEIYSNFILENLDTGLLPEMFYRNVSDFQSGETLNIPTIGDVTIQDVTENEDYTYNPIDSDRIQLVIDESVGDAFYITDKMREDGYNVDALLAARGRKGAQALKEYHQTNAFATLYAAQTAADPNEINGFAHRIVGSGAGEQLEITDFSNLGLAFDKANVPYEGRVAIVDPVTARYLETKFQGTYNVDANPTMQMLLEQGLGMGMQFRMELFGWNVMVSNLLPDVAAGTNVDGSGAITNAGKANLFMSIMDDQHTPLMYASRREPSVETERNKDKRRDEFAMSARWGFGAQRLDTLAVAVSRATA